MCFRLHPVRMNGQLISSLSSFRLYYIVNLPKRAHKQQAAVHTDSVEKGKMNKSCKKLVGYIGLRFL